MAEIGAIIPAEQNNLKKVEEQFETMEEKIRYGLKKQKAIGSELKTKQSLLKSALENDADYYKANEEVKDAQRARKAIKDKVIAKNPGMKTLNEQITVLKDQKKSIQLTLADYILEYTEKTGMQTIEDEDGVVRNIKVDKLARIV